MHVITARNVNEALPVGFDYLFFHGEKEESRVGPVLVSPTPVTTAYMHPCERVLFSRVRDANPFFHLTEAFWMLLGRADAALLDNFVRDFGARFAEKDGLIHGAYGRRWRRHFVDHPTREPLDTVGHVVSYLDQISMILSELRNNPGSRQCVLTMWDPEVDLGAVVKDKPCNTQVYFRIRGDRGQTDHGNGNVSDYDYRVLDMTVCCRSNDIIMGAYGANAVHFSVLQEYLATCLGVAVGTYHQVSFNYHMYVRDAEVMTKRAGDAKRDPHLIFHDAYSGSYRHIQPRQLVSNPDSFIREVGFITQAYEVLENVGKHKEASVEEAVEAVSNQFLYRTWWKMLQVHRRFRNRDLEGADLLSHDIEAEDWRIAVQGWLKKRRTI